MIRFRCRCKRPLAVPDDQAGGTVQCRHCGRLNDVPSIDDAAHIDDDGAYKLGDDAPPTPGRTARDHKRQTVDLLRGGGRNERGESRDLRLNIDEFLAVGTPTDANLDADDLIPDRPHYDPLTGELVRPLDLKRDDPPAPAGPLKVEPVGDDEDVDALAEIAAVGEARRVERPAARKVPPAARPVGGPRLTYANRATDPSPHVPPSRVPVELCKPANVTVMAFVLLGHLALVFVFALPSFAVILAFLPMVAIFLLLAGHYGNVVEEIGPVERDELPTPMRGFSFGDDIWLPAVRVFGATLACFGVAGLAAAHLQATDLANRASAVTPAPPPVDPAIVWGVLWAGLAVGALLFPAALLTATTAGAALANLAPHRVVGTALVCGRHYLASLGLFVATVAVYAVGVRGVITTHPLPAFLTFDGRLGAVLEYAVGLPALCVAVYLAHLFCWHLGLLYRAHHGRFPWLYQKHEARRDDTMAELERRRAARREQARQALADRQSAGVESLTGRPAPRRVLPVD